MRRVAASLAILVMVFACSPERSAVLAPSMSIGNPINIGSKEPYTLAVIGDTPYGPRSWLSSPTLSR